VLKEENYRLKGGSEGDRRRIKDLETRLVNAEAANGNLLRKNNALIEAKRKLEEELDDRELHINATKKQQQKCNRKLRSLKSQQEVLNNELAQRMQDEEDQKLQALYDKNKLRKITKVVLNKTVSDPDVSTLERDWKRKPLTSAKSNQDVSMTPVPTPRRSTAVANPRYRRSRSAGQVWIDHQSEKPVPMNTVMTPILKKKRSLTKVSEKDLVDPKVSNYMVTHQEQDSDGDVETKIFKVDNKKCNQRKPLTPNNFFCKNCIMDQCLN